jgi:hypothetical protein
LLEAPEPYLRYQAQRLLEPKRADRGLLDADPFIAERLETLRDWKSQVLERHDKVDLFIHTLAMLADLGVDSSTKGVGMLVEGLLDNFAADGSFPILIRIPKAFGGTGEANKHWLICDFPVIVYALLKMVPGDGRLASAVEKLKTLVGEAFYPCCGSIPKFKGPGPRGGMCPYANLLAARALAASPEASSSKAAMTAAKAILWHWEHRKEKKPFLFAMGRDFQKTKFPLVWYNILHVVTALKGIKGIAKDPRFLEIRTILESKLDSEGRVTAESIYMAYKAEEWSNKKAPSRLMTIMVHRALT